MRGFPWLALIGIAIGFVMTVGASRLVEHDPLADLGQLGVVPPVPGSLAWPTGIALVKRKPGEQRVVFLGASETVAMPYEPAGRFGYGYMLGAGLQRATGRTDLLVRADGGIALDSPQLLEQARKILKYGDPSAIVFVVGGNEFLNRMPLTQPMLGDGVIARVGDLGASAQRLWRLVDTWMRDQALLASWFASPAVAGTEGGFDLLVRNARPGRPALRGLPIGENDRALLLDRLEATIETLVRECEEKGVRVLLALAPHGYDVQPPWCSAQHPSEAGLDELLAKLLHGSLEDVDTSKRDALRAFMERSDGARADTHHAMARILRRSGESLDVRRAYETALDLDLVPLHRTSAVRARLEAIADAASIPLIVLEDALFADDGIPDPRFFLDYAHPTLEGHRRIARWLAETHLRVLLPDVSSGDATWWENFDAGVSDFAAGVSERSVQRARGVMQRTVGSYYLCFGNFRDALPALEEAVEVFGDEDSSDARRARADLEFCRAELARAGAGR